MKAFGLLEIRRLDLWITVFYHASILNIYVYLVIAFNTLTNTSTLL